jgi:predicted ATPase
MEIVWTVVGAIAVVVAIASNVTNVGSYLDARRERRAGRRLDRDLGQARSVATWQTPSWAVVRGPAPDAAEAVTAGAVAASAPVAAAAEERHEVRPAPAVQRPPGHAGLPPLDLAPRPSIRTPDQRVRVFVSSTLAELADERTAVRAAVEALRLTPVMFEAGARAHPPRDLYRAYLDQSDVFVGIYAARYGWVAPGEEVSGLEDEYLRSGERPKLIYVRRVDGQREPRLEGLLARIRDDDRVSYRPFRDAAELRELVADDLATLLSERFDRALDDLGQAGPAPVPVVWGPLFGRQREVEHTCALLADPQVRLVTLLGPGGIGKSRLALEVAHRLRSGSGDGVVFVGLQGVQRSEAVPGAIADALGLRGAADRDTTALLLAYLTPRRMTLVVDNLEQVIDAAPLLSRLLEVAPELKVLATSRTPLRLSAERCLPLGPLTLPEAGARTGDDPVETARTNPAVSLFVWRAQSADPTFEVDADNAASLLDLVRALEGWPLAILLAAARAGHLSLADLHRRLGQPSGRRLDALSGGARDMPERQQTLRRTIAWSLEMLAEEGRVLLRRMSVFAGGAALEGIEAVAGVVDEAPAGAAVRSGRDVVDVLADLVDHSLVQRVTTPAGTRYLSFELVRAAAAEQLAASGEAEAVHARHAAYFERFSREHGRALHDGRPQGLPLLRAENDNLRAAIAHHVARGEVAAAASMARSLWLFWWIQSAGAEQLPWLRRLLQRDDLGERERADLLLALCACGMEARDLALVARAMDEAEGLFERIGDAGGTAVIHIGRSILASWAGDLASARRHGEAVCATAAPIGWAWAETFGMVMIARAAIGLGDLDDAARWAAEAARRQRAAGDTQSESWARLALAVALALRGECEAARREAERALRNLDALAFHAAVVFGLEVAAFVAATAGERERALRIAAAAAGAQRQFGSARFEPETTIAREAVERLRREHTNAEDLHAWIEGGGMPLDVAVRYVLGGRDDQIRPNTTAAF